jgi:hypothetical protein
MAAAMVLELREAERMRVSENHPNAARAYSSLLLELINAPWRADPALLRAWSDALRAEQRHWRWNKRGDWPSIQVKVETGDNLIELRKRVVKENPELLVCTGQITRANELPSSVIHPGEMLRIPTERARMLVDLDAHWAFYLLGQEVVAAWEVGVGKDGSETKTGQYLVGDKRDEPMWFRAGKPPVPYGDPENPLGTRWIAWLQLDGSGTGLGFHGTNDPASIGKDQSQGCIRMRNPDVEELAEILPRGASITVQR